MAMEVKLVLFRSHTDSNYVASGLLEIQEENERDLQLTGTIKAATHEDAVRKCNFRLKEIRDTISRYLDNAAKVKP